MNQSAFRFAFTVGPLLIASVVPSILFGILVDQWGSNLGFVEIHREFMTAASR
jgi:hypothetical protein